MITVQGKDHLVRLHGGVLILLVHHLEGDIAGDRGGRGKKSGHDGPVDVE